MPTILLIDSCLDALHAAVAVGSDLDSVRILASDTRTCDKGIAEALPSLTRLLLEQSRVETIDVGISNLGPGSFTALRTSLSFLFGLALSSENDCSVYGVSSFLQALCIDHLSGVRQMSMRANKDESYSVKMSKGEIGDVSVLPTDSLDEDVTSIDDLAFEERMQGMLAAFFSYKDLCDSVHIQQWPRDGFFSPMYVKRPNAKTLKERGLIPPHL